MRGRNRLLHYANLKTAWWLFLAATVAIPGVSQSLTPSERARALRDLEASQTEFLDSVAGLTDAQWTYHPAPDVWSIAECAEHIALSEDTLLQVIEKVAHSPF